MFTPEKMCKINVLVLSKHLNAVTGALGRSGLVHLIDAVSQSRQHLLSAVDLEQEHRRVGRMLERCEMLLEAFGIERDADIPSVDPLELGEMEPLLDKVFARYREQDVAIAKLLRDADAIGRETSRFSEMPLQTVKLEALRNLSHFYMVTGRLRPDAFLRARQALEGKAIFIRDEAYIDKVLVLASRKSRWSVEDDLGKYGFQKIELPEDVDGTLAEKRQDMETQVDWIRAELDRSRLAMVRLGEQYGAILLAVRHQLHTYVAIQKAQSKFGHTSQLYCVSGWVPSCRLEQVRSIVDEASTGVAVLEATPADQDEMVKSGLDQVPVKLNAGPWRRPFQMLVVNFSTPNYNEIDPSVFVGITFVLMFGYMFGDVGQGAVLALAGLCLRRSRRPLSQTVRDLGMLLVFCGFSAAVFGLLYGSYFGYENHRLLPPLWLSPLQQQDMPKLLLTAVILGVIFLSVAVFINIVNHFLARRYFDGTFDKFGIVGICFYWGVIGIALHAAVTRRFAPWELALVALPLLLLFVREPLHNLLRHGKLCHQGGLLHLFMESGIELMETLTGYLSGTISFVRVGAFAVSHAALCLAVYSIVGMLKDLPGGGLLALLVIILGNLLIILFEGMVAAIQCVRLEYYELFSRFLQGGGIAYKPFRLDGEEADKP